MIGGLPIGLFRDGTVGAPTLFGRLCMGGMCRCGIVGDARAAMGSALVDEAEEEEMAEAPGSLPSSIGL